MAAERITVLAIADRIQLAVNNAKAVPFTGKVIVEKEDLTRLLNQLSASMPENLALADQVLTDKRQILEESQRQADSTTHEAAQQAQATLNDAQNRAGEMLRNATDQANAMVADAQARANAMIADAQARAQQLVADSEIIARATAEAQEMMESTHRECEEFTARTHAAVTQMVEHADRNLSQQLDALRALRQELTNS